jgi:hypothetical protein
MAMDMGMMGGGMDAGATPDMDPVIAALEQARAALDELEAQLATQGGAEATPAPAPVPEPALPSEA